VHAGEEIVIARDGEPYARLVPLGTRPPRRQAGTLKNVVRTLKLLGVASPGELDRTFVKTR
jgi:antitoxin (DNA-binding transcriptional repressor) of toxin-antitoxin stability system